MIIILINNKQLSEKELTQIFKLLKHPLRRAILKQLSKSPRAYSQILKNLNIQESSILNYHLRQFHLKKIFKKRFHILIKLFILEINLCETPNETYKSHYKGFNFQ